MSKFYPEIILGGDDFSPQKIIERYKVNIEHMYEKCNTIFYSDIIIGICKNFKEFNVTFVEEKLRITK